MARRISVWGGELSNSSKKKGRLICLFAILAAGLLLRLLLIRHQVYDNEDDLFLYLTIARQRKLTGMISFDGLAPTNGFHPLWLLVCRGIILVLPDRPDVTLPALLITGGVLWLAGAGLLVRAVAEAGFNIRPRGAAESPSAFPLQLALLCWLVLGSGPALLSINGMESSLVLLSMAGLALAFLRLGRGWPGALLFGAASAFAILSRTDSAPLVVLLALAFLLQRPRTGALKQVVRGGTACLVLCLPWIIWNLATFGTIVQVSSIALSEGLRQRAYSVGLGYAAWKHFDTVLKAVGFLRCSAGLWVLLYPAIAVLVAIRAVCWVRRGQAESPIWKPFEAFAVVFVAAHSANLVYRSWYTASLVASLGLAFCAVGFRLGGKGRLVLAACLIACLPLGYLDLDLHSPLTAGDRDGLHRTWDRLVSGQVPRALEEPLATRRRQELVRRGLITKAHDANYRILSAHRPGMFGYFATYLPDTTVVEAEGVVNNQLMQARRTGDFWTYVKRYQITEFNRRISTHDETIPLYLLGGQRQFTPVSRLRAVAANVLGIKRKKPKQSEMDREIAAFIRSGKAVRLPDSGLIIPLHGSDRRP